jgi:valacyclovir hydrolase
MVQAMGQIYGDQLQDLWSAWCDAMIAIYQAGGDVCRERLHEIHCPTFLLQGEKDPLVPNFHAEVLHQGIAGSRLHVFPEGKHNIHQAHATEFNRMMVEFLRS